MKTLTGVRDSVSVSDYFWSGSLRLRQCFVCVCLCVCVSLSLRLLPPSLSPSPAPSLTEQDSKVQGMKTLASFLLHMDISPALQATMMEVFNDTIRQDGELTKEQGTTKVLHASDAPGATAFIEAAGGRGVAGLMRP